MTFFSPRRLARSFRYAFQGLVRVFRSEQNFRIHVLAAALVFLLIALYPVTPLESAILVLVVVAVLVIELMNTIVESLLDLLKPRLHHHAGVVKDLMAAAALIASIGALVVGLIIFLPYFLGTKP